MYEWNSDLYRAWKNGKEGKSSIGQGYGAFQGLVHNEGARERESASAASTSSYSPLSFASTTSSREIGLYKGDGRTSNASSGTDTFKEVLGGILSFIVILFLIGIFSGGDKKTTPAGNATAVEHNSTTTPLNQATGVRGTSAFKNGATDRNTWESWFNSTSGDQRNGAQYWATVRSTSNPGSCLLGRGEISDSFRSGCLAAQKFFTVVDSRRRSDHNYWCGWNDPERLCD